MDSFATQIHSDEMTPEFEPSAADLEEMARAFEAMEIEQSMMDEIDAHEMMNDIMCD